MKSTTYALEDPSESSVVMAYSSFSESRTKCCRTSKNATINNAIVNKVQNNRLLITGLPLRVLKTMYVL